MPESPDRIDYQETSDVTEVHASIQREHSEPLARVTPIPVWLSILSAGVLAWAGTYLGVFHGGLSGNVYNEYESSPNALFPLPSSGIITVSGGSAPQTLVELGKGVYSNCVPCHQPGGNGIAGQFPTLVKSHWVTGSEKRLVAILLKGLQGPLEVEGKTYNGVMPAWEKVFTDKKIAAVVSYIRSSWGNLAPEISEAKVAAARKEFNDRSAPWSQADLLAIPDDATLPDAAGGVATLTAITAKSTGGVSTVASVPAGGQFAEGKAGYMSICVACHQPTGVGLPGAFPTLVKTEYVGGDSRRLAAMILKGVIGPITVDGKLYNNMMPGQEAVLNDKKIAAILTYVRSSFGNSDPAVSADIVAAARREFSERKTPWTETELKAFGGSAPVPNALPQPTTPSAPAVPTAAPSGSSSNPPQG